MGTNSSNQISKTDPRRYAKDPLTGAQDMGSRYYAIRVSFPGAFYNWIASGVMVWTGSAGLTPFGGSVQI
jgi:hypothetical protein